MTNLRICEMCIKYEEWYSGAINEYYCDDCLEFIVLNYGTLDNYMGSRER